MRKKLKVTNLSATYADDNWVWKCPVCPGDAIMEVVSVMSLNHPNIIKFNEVIWGPQPRDAAKIKMKKFSTYEERNHFRPFSTPDIEKIICGIVSGLSCIHSRGIIHTDIKLQNYVYDGDEIILIDFNSIIFAAVNEWPRYVQTVGYRAPEVVHNNDGRARYSAAIDIWGAGCVMYQLLTGDKFMDTSIVLYEDSTEYLHAMIRNSIEGLNPASRADRLLDLETHYNVLKKNVETAIISIRPDAARLVPIVLACLELLPTSRPTAAALCLMLDFSPHVNHRLNIIDGFFNDSIMAVFSQNLLSLLSRPTLAYAQTLFNYMTERAVSAQKIELLEMSIFIASSMTNRNHFAVVREMDKITDKSYKIKAIGFLISIQYAVPLP